MKVVPGRQGAASKIPQGTAQGEDTQALGELVVVPAGREQQVSAARGLEIPGGRTRDTFSFCNAASRVGKITKAGQ